MPQKHHISICICTYRRPEMLRQLLSKIEEQETEGLFDYSIVIVDNDRFESARQTAESRARQSKISISYYVEPEQNIALARNQAVQNATGDFLAFIDDDEFPTRNWLGTLYKALHRYKADGVLGPVKPYFENEPPLWIVKGKLFERPSHKTGLILHWKETRTGNVLLRRSIFNESENLFNPEFRHSEDQDFFRRMTEKDYIFVWCNKAPVYETQTSDRFKIAYFLRRALLRGNVSLKLQSHKGIPVLMSIIAFLIYTLSFPVLFFTGHHIFIKYLIKDCDHIGRLMAACGLDIQRYLS